MLKSNDGQDFKRYVVMDYLSDVLIRAYGKSIKELFENAAEGMFSLIIDIESIEKKFEKKMKINLREKIGLEDLLIIWLEKILYLNEVNDLIFSEFKIIDLINNESESRISALLKGEKINLKKHEIFLQIKAPTYHNLFIKQDNEAGIFTVDIVFDV
ncbi:MAG: archease [Actinobacteria bacterium]|nr:archease [Actinomycetota bacterium]